MNFNNANLNWARYTMGESFLTAKQDIWSKPDDQPYRHAAKLARVKEHAFAELPNFFGGAQ